MSMQLFSFGHPCEHQLHRACIGGSNCPLNGYPDTWCCSFIKGKINFKRDRPCEGPRCHWDFVHPTQSQFEEVTEVLEQSRPIAAKLDEAKDTDLLSFQITNPHIIDTVQCALHMMRHPPSSCARRVGQLLAYAAVLAGDQDVFVQLLKTMKKPVDGYILGAYAFLTQSKTGGSGGGGGGGEKGGGNQKGGSKKQNKKKDAKDDISPTLANIMVELMNAALSLGGQLVDREDQHVLQAMLIKALSTYPKSDKRHQEMLERAIAKFGNRKLDDEEEAAARREAAAATTTTTTATAANTTAAASAPAPAAPAAKEATAADSGAAPPVAESADRPAAPPASTTTAAAAATPKAAAVLADGAATPSAVPRAPSEAASTAATTPALAPSESPSRGPPLPPPPASTSAAPPSSGRRSPRDEASAAATPRTVFSSAPGTPSATMHAGAAIAAIAALSPNGGLSGGAAASGTAAAPPLPPSPGSAHGGAGGLTLPPQSAAAPPAGTTPAAPTATTTAAAAAPAAAVGAATPTFTAAPAPSAAAAAAAATPGPVVGISRILPLLQVKAETTSRRLDTLWPVFSRRSLPTMYLCGGQFSLRSQVWGRTPLGTAEPTAPCDRETKELERIAEERKQARQRAKQVAEAELAGSSGNPTGAPSGLRGLGLYSSEDWLDQCVWGHDSTSESDCYSSDSD